MKRLASPPQTALRASFVAVLSGLVALGMPGLSIGAEAASEALEKGAGDPPESAAEQVAPPNEGPAPEAGEESAEASEEGGAETESPAEEPAEDEEEILEAAPGEYRNWFDVSVGGLVADGDKGAAQARLGVPAAAFGGVESFHFEKDVGKRGLFKVDGRGIFDAEDYRLQIDYTDLELGYVRGGVTRRRSYFDGSGGWFPWNNQWISLYDDALELVRGTAFFEAGLRKANVPEITLWYQHDYRDGQKDSTIWGDTGLTGGAGVRSIVPTFQDIDEQTDLIRLDVRHVLGNTTLGAGFTYESFEMDNSRNMRRRPFETSDRHITQTERVERDLLSARAFVETVFNERVRASSAYLFTTLETDLGGSRIVGSDYEPVYDPVFARRDMGFLNLAGGSQLDQHVWNVNGMWRITPQLTLIPAVRIENQSLDGSSRWLETGAENLAREAANARDMLDVSQKLELRYTGVTNLALYARGDWTQGDGSLLERQTLLNTGTEELYRDSDFDRFSQKYTAGAHWYPLRRVNVHAQYYRKMRGQDYGADDSLVNASGYYPDFIRTQDFVTDDVNFRVAWRVLDNLTLMTRYDFQWNTVEMKARGRDEITSGEGATHIIGETVTWTPVSWLYIQPAVNYVMDSTKSGAGFEGSPTPEAENDYVTLSGTIGLVIDNRTDLQAQYTCYLADNFENIASVSQPYGADVEEHGFLATLTRRISPRLRVLLRYGFFTSRSDMSGGHNDYDAHYLFSSAQCLF